jgi:hypothetical protein
VKLIVPNATLKPPSGYNIGSGDFGSVDDGFDVISFEQDEDFSESLQKLMEDHKPLDLSGQVIIPDYRKAIHGGLAVVYTGLWGDVKVMSREGDHISCSTFPGRHQIS